MDFVLRLSVVRAIALVASALFVGGCIPYKSHLEPLVKDMGAVWVPAPDMYIAFGLEDKPFGDAELSRAIRHLKPLPRLVLVLQGTQITDASSRHIATLSKLKELDVSSTRISDASIPALAQLRRLEELTVSDTDVSPEGLRKLRAAKRLKRIVVGQGELSAEQAQELRRELPRVKVFVWARGLPVPYPETSQSSTER